MMHQKNAALLLMSLAATTARADLVPEMKFVPPERKDIETRLLQEVIFSVEDVEARASLMPIRNASPEFQESVWRTLLILDRSTETRVALLEVREKDLEAAKKLKEYLVKYQGARPETLLITLRDENEPIPEAGKIVIHFAEDAVARKAASLAGTTESNEKDSREGDFVRTSQAAAMPVTEATSPSRAHSAIDSDPWPSPFTGKARRTRITESLIPDSPKLATAAGDSLSVSQASAVRLDGSSPFLSVHGDPGSNAHRNMWRPSRFGFEVVPEFASSETLRGTDLDSRATGVWLRTQFHADAEIVKTPIFGLGPEITYTRSLAAVSGEGRGLVWWDGFAGLQMNLRANSTRYWIPNAALSVGYGRMGRSGTGADRWIAGYDGLETRLDLNLPVDAGFQLGLEGGYLTGRTATEERFRLVTIGGHLDQDLGIDVLGSPIRARMGASASLRGAAAQQETVTTVLLGFSMGML